jgi:hypothetical protein
MFLYTGIPLKAKTFFAERLNNSKIMLRSFKTKICIAVHYMNKLSNF